MSHGASNDTGKQAVLPLWGKAASAHGVRLAAMHRFTDLCETFVAADAGRNEPQMEWCISEMRAVVQQLGAFQRTQFRKWAAERSANRS